MRVLMIAPTSFFSDYGGHIRILEEIRGLQQLGLRVAVVTYYKGNDVPGVDIRRTRPLPWHADYEVGSSRHKIAFDVYLAAQSLLEARRFRPDVVHGHMHEGALIGGVLARAIRAPLVFDFQGSLTAEMIDHHFIDPGGWLFPVLYRVEGAITRRLPDAILTSSASAMQLLTGQFNVPTERIVPLPDCADPVRFDPAKYRNGEISEQLRRQLGIPAGRVVIGYLGLLTDYQGIPHLIEAAVQLKEENEPVHFLVMGYPNVDRYQETARLRGVEDRMTFTGRVPFESAPDYLAACDIAVAPKISSSEGSGKLLNYMAMALPIVVYDTPVNREYLGDLGVYAPAGDVAALGERLSALAVQPEYRRLLGEQLRRRAIDHFSWAAASERIASLYRDLIAGKAAMAIDKQVETSYTTSSRK